MGAPKKGSINDRIGKLEVGQRLYIETELEWFSNVQRSVSTHSRRPPEMFGMNFTCKLMTAVGHAKAGDIQYLVCVERIA